LVAARVDERRAYLDLLHASGDERFDFLGGSRAALRQAAHFAGHDGKATAMYSCH